jgi:hypothetical protein
MEIEKMPLSNLQLELLKLYAFDLSHEELADLKKMLARQFADRLKAVCEGKSLAGENMETQLNDEEKNAGKDSSDVFDVLDRLTGTVEAPCDWAADHDYYLYGAPRKNDQEV